VGKSLHYHVTIAHTQLKILKVEIEITKKAKKQGGNRPASIPTCELKHALEIVTNGSLFGLNNMVEN